MDNTPLWAYLRSATDLTNDNAPNACVVLAQNINTLSWDFYDKKDQLVSCLQA